jgi:hypothetical protein
MLARRNVMALPEHQFIDVEDYLALDRSSKEKRYEYFDGELRMLAGGGTYHSRIIMNLASTIHRLLQDSPCYVYNSGYTTTAFRVALRLS